MDYELSSIIKKEKQEFVEDKNDNYLPLRFDIKIKVENETILDDWCLQNVSSTNDYETISYLKLKEECEQSCVICNENFTDSFSLYKHNLIHLKVPLIRRKLFMCDACPAFYKKKKDLQNHILLTHQPKRLYYGDELITKSLHKCQICEKTFAYKSWFDHIKNVHGQLKLKCEKCNLTFKCERYLKRHILYTHEGVKPPWRYHKVKSANIKTYIQCEICPARFTNKNSLTTHIRNCHSEKKFQCKICKSILKSKSYLLTHINRVHYDDGKLHCCDVCGKIFKSPRYVRVHIKNSHSSQKKYKKKKT
ncbi:zinc finger protein 267-like [Vanessa atalanta]|uniref:zinc finger protein 267-like n=1 Tax=Vanessa atalanta TaxID=42275 RepID=UPI001FCDEED2|nr:zinc finger protein 267-like [Vanessa atalanta]